MLLGMMLVAAAFAAVLTGVVANSGDDRSDTAFVGVAIGALIIGTPIVLISNIWANLYARDRVFPVYVISWITMLVIASISVREADSGVSTAIVIVFAAPGVIILPIQVFLLRLGKRFAAGWPFSGGRTAGHNTSSSDTSAPYMAYGLSDATHHFNDDPKSSGEDWYSQSDATPDTGSSGSSDSGSSDSGGSSSGGDSGGSGGGDSGGSSS